MKRTIITYISALICCLSYAAPVGPVKAARTAAAFFGTDENAIVSVNVTKASSDLKPFHIFNRTGGGWVIIAGDDVAVPVIAYSPAGSFRTDGLPSNLRRWLDGVSREIASASSAGIPAREAVRKKWESPAPVTKASGDLYIETAEWGQEDPYNYYCPNVSENGKSVRSVTGCVSTAMAIVLRSRKWPEQGTGTIPSYKYISDENKTVTVPARDISAHSYDWDNMPLKSSEVRKALTKQKQAIAELMYDCGVMVSSNYNYSTGTGAFSSDVSAALARYMGYSPSATEYYRYHFDINDWVAMLRKELRDNGPLLYYGATDDDEGHAFVLSGYDSEDRFYANWGWDGNDNGYYSIMFLGEADYKFTESQSAIFGLVKAGDGPDMAMPVLCLTGMEEGDGIKLVSGKVAKGGTFTISAEYVWNDGSVDYNGAVRAVLVDRDGRFKEYAGEPYSLKLDAPDEMYDFKKISNYSCSFTSETALGDAIEFWYSLPDGSWTPVLKDHDYGIRASYAVYDANFIIVEDSYRAGDNFRFRLLCGNRIVSSVTWYFDGARQSDISLARKLTKGTHTVKAVIKFVDGGTEAIFQTISAD